MEIYMKSQRLRITERGWENFSDYLAGVKFENGLSVDVVAPAVINQIGSALRVEAVDDGFQGGNAAVLNRMQKQRAEVVRPLTEHTPQTVSPEQAASAEVGEKYTRESLEAIADKDGIAGLRAIGDKLGVKGRGIIELITEILRAQG
jgi:hypothetical protein